MLTIRPINSLLVKVEKEDNLRKLNSGLIVVEDSDKGSNVGVVEALPFLITKGFEEYKEFVESISIGDKVVFNSKLSYPALSVDSKSVYLLVGLENIFALIKD